jgi:hypothetical protein
VRRLRTATEIVWKGWDFRVGLIVGVAVGLLASSSVRRHGVTGLLAEAAIGVAILSVVLAALAIIAPAIDGFYRQVLDKAGGVREAMAPYLLIGAVAGIAAILSLVGAILWPAAGPAAQRVVLGSTSGLTVWAIGGAISLVEITIFHATQRSELLSIVDTTEEEVRVRRLEARSSNPGSPEPRPRTR